jgi:hypothetical protein
MSESEPKVNPPAFRTATQIAQLLHDTFYPDIRKAYGFPGDADLIKKLMDVGVYWPVANPSRTEKLHVAGVLYDRPVLQTLARSPKTGYYFFSTSFGGDGRPKDIAVPPPFFQLSEGGYADTDPVAITALEESLFMQGYRRYTELEPDTPPNAP